MTKEKTYLYVLGWLEPLMRVRFEGSDIVQYTSGHKPLKGIISSLWAMFDDCISEDRERRIRYSEGSLYIFNGEYYEEVKKDFLEEVSLRILISLGVSTAYRLVAPSQIAGQCLKRIASSDRYIYEPNRRYICFTNGVFDVKDGKLKPFRSQYCTDLVLDFPYLSQKELDIESVKEGGIRWETNYARLWDKKLDEIIPNRDLQGDFQQFCGSLLLNRDELKVEYLCFLVSNGANGKSTLANAVASVFGDKYVSTFSPQEIFTQGSSSQFVINEMAGKILNLCDDLDFGKLYSSGRMKGFVSGEKLTGRGLYSSEFRKVQPPMMLVCSNDFPYTDDDSWGYHRRQMIIKCTNTIPKEVDRELGLKLRSVTARQRIFLWMYRGAKRVMDQKGIELSARCRQDMMERTGESSPMRIWATEMGFSMAIPRNNQDRRWYRLTELYQMYRQFCLDNGYKPEADARKISGMLVSLGCEKKNLSGKGTQICVGRLGVDTDMDGRLIIKSRTKKEKKEDED